MSVVAAPLCVLLADSYVSPELLHDGFVQRSCATQVHLATGYKSWCAVEQRSVRPEPERRTARARSWAGLLAAPGAAARRVRSAR